MATPYEPSKGKSLEDIAALMAENTMKMRGQTPDTPEEDNTIPNEVNEVTDDVAEAEESPSDEVIEDTSDDAVDDDGPDEEEASDVLEDEPEVADNDFEIDDDTLFEVDEDTQVSFKDLRAAYTANKDQAELVETQRTAAQEALAARQSALMEVDDAKKAAMAVFEHFEQLVSTPMISAPDNALKTTNPEQYIRHLEAYNKDQERIAQNKQDLSTVFDEHVKKENELKTNLRQQVITEVQKLVPQLASSDETVRKTAGTDIIEASEYYGFSKEEVNEATDPRLYQMAHDAQQYRKLLAKTGKTTVHTKENKIQKVKNQTRTLRSKGTTAKTRLTAKARLVKQAKEKAKASGKPADVAAFIAAQKGA